LPERYGSTVTRLRVDIWSDIACPWCYVGKRRLEAALSRFEHAEDIDLHWRSFELDPDAKKSRGTYAERLATKYRVSLGEAESMIERMTRVAADEGLEFHFDRIRAGNTFDAHRLLHLAGARGRQTELNERLLRAYMTEGKEISAPAVLASLAVEVGLDEEDVRDVLDTDRYAIDVRTDELQARELEITGVPFFVFDRRLGVAGAQSADILLVALGRALAEQSPELVADASCGPEGCN
jgi:predicted DsbA family dithiol-disulfide isomerase